MTFTYKPMQNKSVKINKHPDKIYRCVNSKGEYVLVKHYVFRNRRKPDGFVVENCKLDVPAEYVLLTGCDSPIKTNNNYELELIIYCLDKGNVNEYELRGLVISYLKKQRKCISKDKFKEICSVFDKADKMLSRADVRKNSSTNEANVSYSFMIKSYQKVIKMCVVEKEIKDKKDKEDKKVDDGKVEVFWSDFTKSMMKSQKIMKPNIYSSWS